MNCRTNGRRNIEYKPGDLLTSTAMVRTAAEVSISGIAKDFSGNPAKNATVFVIYSKGDAKISLT